MQSKYPDMQYKKQLKSVSYVCRYKTTALEKNKDKLAEK